MFEALKLRIGRSFVSVGRLLQQPIRLGGIPAAQATAASRHGHERPGRERGAERTGERPGERPSERPSVRTSGRTSEGANEGKKERAVALRMQSDLAGLLDQHTSTRRLMRYLDLVDRVLRRSGLAAWERLPTRVHVKALAELESLVTDWSAAGLAELRSRTAVLLKGRPVEAAAERARIVSAEIDATQRADVSEVEHAVYEEMERSWIAAGPLTAAEAAAAARPMPVAAFARP